MTIQQIKQNLSITTVLAHYGLSVNGNNRMCCPFHNDTKPSMEVFPKSDTVFCFSSNCEVHGKPIDVIDFVMHQEKLSKHEAILKCKSLLGATGGVGAPSPSLVQAQPAISEKVRVKTMTAAFAHFQKAFAQSKAAQAYMQSRGLEGIQEVGFHDGKLSKPLRAGLDTLGISSAWGRGCIIFPLKNAEGDIVSFYGRSISNEGDQRHFYSTQRQGLYPGYPDAQSTKYLVLTESVIDAASFPVDDDATAVLALYGTNGLTPAHKQLVVQMPHLEEIYLFFDGDDAGRKALKTRADELWKVWLHGASATTQTISSVPTPEGEDVNSLLVAYGEVVEASDEPSIFHHLLSQKTVLYSGGGSAAKVSSNGTTAAPAPGFRFDTSNPKKLVLETLNGRYQLQGAPKPELESMKVTLFIYPASGGSKSRHKVDLYEDRQMEKVAREANAKLGVAYELLLIDLNQLADELEAYRDAELAELAGSQSQGKQPKPVPAALQKDCLALLRSADLMTKLNEHIGACGVVGEEMNRLLLFCVASSYKMPDTLHAIVQGSSGSGKSHLLNAILELMPEEGALDVTRITDRSLYNYGKYDLCNKLFVLQDLDGLSEEALLSFRELISYGKLASSTTTQDLQGRNSGGVKEVYGPVASMAATTKTELYEDNENRCFTLAVNETRVQTKAITDYMNACSAGKVSKKKQLTTKELLQNCVRLLRPHEVVNPYATQLSLPAEVKNPRRLHNLYQSLVKQITLLHQFQRARDDEGRLVATKSDLHWANEILFETIILRIDELDGSLRQFFEQLKNYCFDKGVKLEFTRREVRHKFRIENTRLHRYMHKLHDLEYIKQVGGHVNKGWTYKITYWDDIQALRSRIRQFLADQLSKLK
ncbi:CHC2 zinc finger domain-containing protein [Microscilla marina]|uniref:CHC2 zinc finger domain protein n=1 Tax=Microscilla marina ATCC 23134 TaxID=313606 RepID=A2A033_MICM2|nr:CHC2 zinc finger domain-containing protein [Microscilla marina]EAY24008.1 CHC2 zinc finger domain protein [Microscilla marina ATCC 23134]